MFDDYGMRCSCGRLGYAGLFRRYDGVLSTRVGHTGWKRVPRCSDDSAAATVKAVLNETGRIDVSVNNAAYELAEALEETSTS